MAEGESRPKVGAALLGEGGTELSEQECLRYEEHNREYDHPGEGFAAVGSDGGDRIDTDDGADEEEQDVEPAEVPAQFSRLDGGGGGYGEPDFNGHCWGLPFG